MVAAGVGEVARAGCDAGNDSSRTASEAGAGGALDPRTCGWRARWGGAGRGLAGGVGGAVGVGGVCVCVWGGGGGVGGGGGGEAGLAKGVGLNSLLF